MRIPPHMQIGIRALRRGMFAGGKRVVRRIKPYEPNFRRILARIIEPLTGAST